MTDTNVDSSDSPSVTATVEKVLRRRQQLLRLFTGLLLIPVLAAVAFAVFGRSQEKRVQEQVQSEVAPVKERLGRLPDPEKLKTLQKEVSDLPAQLYTVQQAVKNINNLQTKQRATLNEQANQIDAIKSSQDKRHTWPNAYGTVGPAPEQSDDKGGGPKSRRDDPLEDFDTRLRDQERIIQDQQKTIQDLQQKLEKLQRECCNRVLPPGTM